MQYNTTAITSIGNASINCMNSIYLFRPFPSNLLTLVRRLLVEEDPVAVVYYYYNKNTVSGMVQKTPITYLFSSSLLKWISYTTAVPAAIKSIRNG